MKRIESLLKIAGVKFQFLSLEIRFYKGQVPFLAVNTAQCKRDISLQVMQLKTSFRVRRT